MPVAAAYMHPGLGGLFLIVVYFYLHTGGHSGRATASEGPARAAAGTAVKFSCIVVCFVCATHALHCPPPPTRHPPLAVT